MFVILRIFLMQSMLYRHFVKCTNLCSCSSGHL